MKWIILLFVFYHISIQAQSVATTGQEILPDQTLDQPTYLNSGPTESRSGDMPGLDLAVPVPNTGEEPQKQNERFRSDFQTGPYDQDGNYRINSGP